MILSTSNLELVRTRPQSTKLHLSIFKPRAVLMCQINDPSIASGARSITFYNVTLGNWSAVEADMTLLIGTTPGGNDVGKIRVRSATANSLTVAENSEINWADNLYLTVMRYFEVLPVYPRIINDPNNVDDVIFYKDYDIPYSNQNTQLGSFVNMGSHRAGFIENGSLQLWYTASGTVSMVTGSILSYFWAFEGGSPTGSNLFSPGWVSYNTPGHYVTRLIVSGSNGASDTSYRYVSVYNPISSGVSLPYQQWDMGSLQGSRAEGGHGTTITIYETNDTIEEGSVVVLFSEDYYGDTKQSLGGNGENNSSIFFVGYVLDGTISYDFEKSTVQFEIGSISRLMREMEGFSVSVESKASPSKWFELYDMDIRKAIYHYLKWHSTVLKTVDFEYIGNNPNVQFFDADRTSLYDAIDNFLRGAVVGKMVTDRQGKLWAEPDITIYPTGTYQSVMEITNRDWMNSPTIDELVVRDLSYLEMGGIVFSGAHTGTFSALISCAPGATPSYRGSTDIIQGLALLNQSNLSDIVKNLYAKRNYRYQSVEMDLTSNFRNLDIAPQEPLHLIIRPSDTVRNVNIDGDFDISSMSWDYDEAKGFLKPNISLEPIVNGDHVEVVNIPDVPPDNGFKVPQTQLPTVPETYFPSAYGTIASSRVFMGYTEPMVSSSLYPTGRTGNWQQQAQTITVLYNGDGLVVLSTDANGAKATFVTSGIYLITITTVINPVAGSGEMVVGGSISNNFSSQYNVYGSEIKIKKYYSGVPGSNFQDTSSARLMYVLSGAVMTIVADQTDSSGFKTLVGSVAVSIQLVKSLT